MRGHLHALSHVMEGNRLNDEGAIHLDLTSVHSAPTCYLVGNMDTQ